MLRHQRVVLTLTLAIVGGVLAVGLYIRHDLRVVRDVLRASASADVPPKLLNAVLAAEDPCHLTHRRTHTLGSVIADLFGNELESANGTLPHASLASHLVGAYTRGPRLSMSLRAILVVVWVEATEEPVVVAKAYAANAYFGGGRRAQIMGVVDAARVYFGKSPNQLDAAECASLAACFQSPNVLAPSVRSPRAVRRRLAILAEMRRLRFISAAEYAGAVRKVVAAG